MTDKKLEKMNIDYIKKYMEEEIHEYTRTRYQSEINRIMM